MRRKCVKNRSRRKSIPFLRYREQTKTKRWFFDFEFGPVTTRHWRPLVLVPSLLEEGRSAGCPRTTSAMAKGIFWQKVRRKQGRTDGRMDGWMDRRTDGWMGRRTDGRRHGGTHTPTHARTHAAFCSRSTKLFLAAPRIAEKKAMV